MLWCLLLLCIVSVSASLGDERESFLTCVKECLINKLCNLTRILHLTAWNCDSDCKYVCMRKDLSAIRAAGERVVQYYGKWPFIRVFGAQEIFSVIFSLGNMLANIYGFVFIYRPVVLKKKNYAWMNRLHTLNAIIAVNTWLQSAIFHYRDLWLTERLDYFSACLLICWSLPIAVIRTQEIKSISSQLAVILPVLALYLGHIYYMAFVSFDYGYNMKFNSVIGALTNAIWIHWSWRNRKTVLGRKMAQFSVANVLVTLMVAIDFPAMWDLIDMHALWHLATIPVTIMWYQLFALDAKLYK